MTINGLFAVYSKYFSLLASLYLTNLLYQNDCFLSLYFVTPFFVFIAYRLLPPKKIKDYKKYKAVIIGGGFSGINSAVRLKQLGIDYVLLEKTSNLGGTWRDNVYPGSACDVPSHLYSFSFFPNPWRWKRSHATQSEIVKYLEDAARHFKIRPKFDQEVITADWDEITQTWNVTTTSGEIFVGNFVFSCCGELHVPNVPKIRGRKEFLGKMFHSSKFSEQERDVIEGKRVGIVGTGASAVQIVPEIADKVEELVVFQKTPVWCPPATRYSYPWLLRFVFALFPPLATLHRWFLFWHAEFKLFPMLDRKKKDTMKKTVVQALSSHVRKTVKDAKTAERLIPTYDYGCKRVCPSNSYLQSFNRSNVRILTERLERLTSKGAKTSNEEIPLDVVVLATGFDLERSHKAFRTKGRHGKVMQEEWGDAPNAYKGSTFPNMPNMFLVLGPNTGVAHNSRVFMIECQVNYAVDCIRMMVSSGHRSMEVKTLVHQDYQAKLGKKMRERVFGALPQSSTCESYYRSARGVVFAMWPGDLTNFWSVTRRCNLQDYNLKR